MPETTSRAGRYSVRRFRRRASDQPPASPIILEIAAPRAVRHRDAVIRAWLLAADLVAALVAALVPTIPGALDGPSWGNALLLLPVVGIVFMAMGLYRRDELLLSANTLDEAPTIFQAATLATVATYLLQSLLEDSALGAQYLAVSLLTLFVAATAARTAARWIARRTTASERCLVVGGADIAERLADKLRGGPTINADLVGRLDLEPADPKTLAGAIRELDVHRVVVAGEGAAPERVHSTIQAAKALGVKVSVLPRMFEVVGSSVAFDYLGGLTVLGVRRFGLSRRQRAVKRIFDLIGSMLLICALAPIMAAFALAIRLTSPGPILFRQTRVGRDGHHFQVFKFRSMVADAEARKAELQKDNEADGLFKIDRDPRITRVGGVLRRTSLDELPQLFNVLRGEMSIVGPRPLILDEDQRIEGYYRRRLHLTPGMTGHWQVLGSARIPLREMVSIDYLYVANWSLWGDIKILLRTIPVVALRRGQ